ncbi:hypothetical protein BDR04DRAFT_1007353, partial [Suillus decipiens]
YFQTFACLLHSLNTMIGNICSFGTMKTIILQMTKFVNFFNSSHYWGRQLNDKARKLGVKWKMKQNFESHFYALICNL